MSHQLEVPQEKESPLRAHTAAAASAAEAFAATSIGERARMLEAVADALDAEVDGLVTIADEETALGPVRLRGETARTTGQLRLFASVIREGSYLEGTIDHADPSLTPPRPDIRRMLHPIGPVAVFSASNFPFAFSVAGGDTASALAAGCPVIVKAHSGHPRLSHRTSEIVTAALHAAGAPEGTFATVHGREIGRELVQDPHIRAVGFTGSLAGGRALFDLAVSRPDPIPFYGELGSLNMVLISANAVGARGPAIAQGFAQSFTLGVGQFCTKPGVVLIPRGSGFEEQVAAAVGQPAGAKMLTPRMAEGFQHGLEALSASGRVRRLAGADAQPTEIGFSAPVVFVTDASDVIADPDTLLAECFGPTSVLVRYDAHELQAILDVLPGSLTATIHAEASEAEGMSVIFSRLRERAGRVVWNGWPTGVAVTWSMQHGGPWPATTSSLHTSVGATAIRRFLRPVAYQNVPDAMLPPPIQESNPLGIPRRVDGRLRLA